jgi:Protein of unknown function (DUF1501)
MMIDNEFGRLSHLFDRRRFLQRTSAGLGIAALASLLGKEASAGPHFPARVKNVIYLFMAGGPSHVDLFDPKPKLQELHGKEIPRSVLGEQRVTLMTRNQGRFRTASTPFKSGKKGKSGIEMTEILPHLATTADELCVIRSLHSEPINHDPAVTFMQTGRPQPGLPCMGSWLSYGLGSENRDLPAFVVMLSGPLDQPIPSRYFHSGFLPSQHQGVQFLPGADPVLYLSNPPGVDSRTRRDLIEGINALNRIKQSKTRDPEIEARINSFELAFRMQTSVPELMDVSKEPPKVQEMYGPEVKNPGSFARHCLLARRLVERGVRFVQLFHRGWDHHSDLANRLKQQCLATDQPAAALLKDLRRRGLLDETLVIWGGEFGRTAYGQGDLARKFGRDHHPSCFTVWMAGGGFKRGHVHGATDDFGYNVIRDPIHVNDWHATLLHQLGIEHTRLTYRFGGRDFRLTDVRGEVVKDILK